MDMDVEKTIAFLLEHQARFEVRMEELADKMDAMLDHQIGVEERREVDIARHDREIAEIRAVAAETRADLRRAVRAGIEEQRRERVRRKEFEASIKELVEALKKDRNGKS